VADFIEFGKEQRCLMRLVGQARRTQEFDAAEQHRLQSIPARELR